MYARHLPPDSLHGDMSCPGSRVVHPGGSANRP